MSSDLSSEKDDLPFKSNEETKSHLPWVEKYRPVNLEQIIHQEHIIDSLRKFISSKDMPHLLLYGPPGTGKTSTIMACARKLYGKYLNFFCLELNASDERGIDTVRQRIKQFVAVRPILSDKKLMDIFKIVILDEIDAMTNDAQDILRKIIEDYAFNARFCLICNDLSRVSTALHSRCTKLRFSPIEAKTMYQYLNKIAKMEEVKFENKGLDAIVKISHGDLRSAINILQSVSMSSNEITEKNVNTCCGYPNKKITQKIMKILLHDNFNTAFRRITKIRGKYSITLSVLINEIHQELIQDQRELDWEKKALLLDKLATVEFNYSATTSDKIQFSALISVFKS